MTSSLQTVVAKQFTLIYVVVQPLSFVARIKVNSVISKVAVAVDVVVVVVVVTVFVVVAGFDVASTCPIAMSIKS